MKPGLSLRVSQHLALTPQLQQSIRLLQLSTLELSQEIEQMLDENPFLERAADTAPGEEFGLDAADTPVQIDDYGADEALFAGASGSSAETPGDADAWDTAAQEPDWGGDGSVELAPNDAEWGGDAPSRNRNDAEGDEIDATELARTQESLTTFLQRQALVLRLSETDRAALHFLIQSLNDDGYLEDPPEALAISLAGPDDPQQIEELLHRFTVALHLLQSLEPVGVGARNLAECLTLQLDALAQDKEADPDTVQTALCICQQPLEMLARRDVRRLTQACGGDEERTRAAMALITRLEPRPGRCFADVERNIVVPDVIVRKAGRMNGRDGQHHLIVQLNPDVLPRLRVHDIYAGALRGYKGGAGHQGMQQRLQEARWFIKNIQQRFDTILRVSRAIVERQKKFFTHGELAMRPLVLRDIADELGLHESTISRVTTAKYMATPIGTYELKYFFGSGLGTETGGSASSTAVRALMKRFVAAENPAKPLSDSQIAALLKEQGIECARRTVAKYREALKIAPANLRKAL
ncbi:RNA polymerase factor sigma-54 [Verminephrobacter aporrectodeae subsp. tuberculatae]|uniref:RNA polymerase factor sigma-54 n=1 Tax=Verminephrobacter aporrectodeae TaxID=1110389 RepID=UPI0022445E03|nr:RNA polymerase factor sigma-54 [Verminephrobacter aporrectodeae]MCW8163359.1 RNA polymerase factor sigma-54 [Verminephrobacter aporrectodeae subsp. tuberculatae]MCW8167588.1 RNA polymerase factor sigma-54 [Verminephrobacter aporrectodeae subsp. tuberculatae]MCW8207977.1 RNA polymerase factor sigma-54 [Verminephrobacter aporrectodeae subsp. tuberculatae]